MSPLRENQSKPQFPLPQDYNWKKFLEKLVLARSLVCSAEAKLGCHWQNSNNVLQENLQNIVTENHWSILFLTFTSAHLSTDLVFWVVLNQVFLFAMSDCKFSQQGWLFQDLSYELSTSSALKRQANTPFLHGSFPISRALHTRKKKKR